jgi:hypothetical protein
MFRMPDGTDRRWKTGWVAAGLIVLGLSLIATYFWQVSIMTDEESDLWPAGGFLTLGGACSLLAGTVLGWLTLCLPLAWAPRVAVRDEALRAAWLASLPTVVLCFSVVDSKRVARIADALPVHARLIPREVAVAITVASAIYLAAFLWRVTRPVELVADA